MAALSEKLLWPIVGIFIFGVLAGFYIDDRRRLHAEGGGEHGGKTAESKHASNEHAGKAADTNKDGSEHAGEAAKSKQGSKEHGGKAAEKSASKSSKSSSSQGSQAAGATSMSMDEYLSESSGARSSELEANVSHHQGFSGGIDEYLSGGKSETKKNTQAEHAGKPMKENKPGVQANGATSMSMDEYQAKSENAQHDGATSGSDAYHGDMDGYLAKYGEGTQTSVSNSAEKPFNQKEHAGFHGSYEEYAKKYN